MLAHLSFHCCFSGHDFFPREWYRSRRSIGWWNCLCCAVGVTGAVGAGGVVLVGLVLTFVQVLVSFLVHGSPPLPVSRCLASRAEWEDGVGFLGI